MAARTPTEPPAMARKRSRPEAVEITAEDIGQEMPDEEPDTEEAEDKPVRRGRPKRRANPARKGRPRRKPAEAEGGGQEGHGFAPPGETISKSAAIRAAVDAGEDSPEDGVAFVKAKYGIDISKQHFSAIKSKYRSGGAPKRGSGRGGRKPKAAEGIPSAPKPARSAGGQADLIAAIEAIKPLVASLGVERVKRIAELLG